MSHPPIRLHVFLEIPSIAQAIRTGVRLEKNFDDLVSHALKRTPFANVEGPFHLYGLGDNLIRFDPESPAVSLFLAPLRRLTLRSDPKEVKRYSVFFEGRRAEIDATSQILTYELISLALECFGLPINEDGYYLALEPKELVAIRIDDQVLVSTLILTRADFWATEVVWTGKIIADVAGIQWFLLANLIQSRFLKSLLSIIRSWKLTSLEFAEFTADRLPEVMEIFLKSGDRIRQHLNLEEMNSLLFLLFGAHKVPFLSRELHSLAIDLMKEPNDIERYEKLAIWAVFLPIQTLSAVSEIMLTYSSIPFQARDVLFRVIASLLFPTSIDSVAEQHFLSFLFICAPFVFGFPQQHVKDLHIYDNRLIVLEGEEGFAYDGPITVTIEELQQFTPPKDYELMLTRGWPRAEEGEKQKVEEFELREKALEEVYNIAIATGNLPTNEDILEGLNFDSLFVTE